MPANFWSARERLTLLVYYWSARGEAPLARHQCLLREELARWERFDLRYQIPIFATFFAKSCEFSCFGGPSGRHSELRNGRNDIILAYLTRGSSISCQQNKNFNLSATYLIRMTESWCREHLRQVPTIRSKIGAPRLGLAGGRPVRIHEKSIKSIDFIDFHDFSWVAKDFSRILEAKP